MLDIWIEQNHGQNVDDDDNHDNDVITVVDYFYAIDRVEDIIADKSNTCSHMNSADENIGPKHDKNIHFSPVWHDEDVGGYNNVEQTIELDLDNEDHQSNAAIGTDINHDNSIVNKHPNVNNAFTTNINHTICNVISTL